MANQNKSRSQPVLPAKRKYASRQSLPFQAWMIQKKRKQRNEVIDKLKALINSLFSASEQGAFYIPRPVVNGTQALFQDAAGTVPVTSDGDPAGAMIDQSGNEHTAVQTISAARPTYNTLPDRLSLDKVDDALIITVPAGGFVGTMVLATDQGTASYGVSIPAGSYELSGQHFPGNAIVGALFRDGALTAGEKADTESYFVGNGATASYSVVSSFVNYWKNRSEITVFPLVDTSNGGSFFATWSGCSKLIIFPQINVSQGFQFSQAWRNCTLLEDFLLLDFSKSGNFSLTWSGCLSLVNFAANSFDTVVGGNFDRAFTNTNLSEASIDGILISLVASGISTGTRVFDQSGGSAPSSTGEAAIDTLRSRGWTVTVTGGY